MSQKQSQADAARAQRMKILGAVIGVAVILVAVAVVLSQSGSSGGGDVKGASEVNSRFKDIPQSALTLGKPDAPVTLREFADLKCPVCKKYNEQAFPVLVKDYVRTGKLRLEFATQAFVGEQQAPGDSEAAGRWAIAMGDQNLAWNFIDLFYLNQQDEFKTYATDAYLTDLTNAIPGADADAALAGQTSAKAKSVLDKSEQEFSDAGFTGTPSFKLGKTGSTLEPFTAESFDPEVFTKAIDALLAAQ
ncbi:MAG: thioredoxin domain-containing protein [Thermoleophilaceae bacterium]|nr:thioredoxin domain-containing protein [Thermoleophilaceae bacterium]